MTEFVEKLVKPDWYDDEAKGGNDNVVKMQKAEASKLVMDTLSEYSVENYIFDALYPHMESLYDNTVDPKTNKPIIVLKYRPIAVISNKERHQAVGMKMTGSDDIEQYSNIKPMQLKENHFKFNSPMNQEKQYLLFHNCQFHLHLVLILRVFLDI